MPNFSQAALSGYQAGQQIRKQQAIDAALQNVDLERPETIVPLIKADPQTGAALLGASTSIANQRRDMEHRQATATYLKTLYGGGSGGGDSGSQAAAPSQYIPDPKDPAFGGLPPPPPLVPAAQGSNDIVATGQRPDASNAARDAAIEADPDSFLKIQKAIDEHLKSASDQQLAQTKDGNEALGEVAQEALKLPYQARQAYIQTQASYLGQHGINPQMIASFDPSDSNLHTQVGRAVGVAKQIESEQRDRQLSQGDAHIAIDQSQLGISAGHLALDRQREGRVASEPHGSGGGTAAAASAPTVRHLPGGVTAYRNPANGKWYDNAAFK